MVAPVRRRWSEARVIESGTPGLYRLPRRRAVRLEAVYPELPAAARRAADYLLTHPDEIQELSIIKLAERAGCSEATSVRLSQRIGYAGYPELTAEFAPLGCGAGFRYTRLHPDDGPAAVMRKIFGSAGQAISGHSRRPRPYGLRWCAPRAVPGP